MTDEEVIWSAVQRSNEAWRAGRPEDVAEQFADDVVMEGPDGRVVARGRAAMVQSYVDYCEQVRTHVFEVREHHVDVFGDAAVVTYAFEVAYESNGQMSRENGVERLVFARRGGRWGAVWRLQTASQSR